MSASGKGTRVLVWGGGGHGRVIADIVRSMGDQVALVADLNPDAVGTSWSVPVISESEFVATVSGGALPAEVEAVALGVGGNTPRLACWHRVSHLTNLALIHKSAIVSASSTIEGGAAVFPGAIINANAFIGHAAVVNSGAIVEHDCVVGDGAHVSPNATLCGAVSIGERAWVGAGATVIPGVRVGEDSVVGAGAVVTTDVLPGVTVVGVPGRPLD